MKEQLPAAIALNVSGNLNTVVLWSPTPISLTVPSPPEALLPETNSISVESYVTVASTTPMLLAVNEAVTVTVSPTVTVLAENAT